MRNFWRYLKKVGIPTFVGGLASLHIHQTLIQRLRELQTQKQNFTLVLCWYGKTYLSYEGNLFPDLICPNLVIYQGV